MLHLGSENYDANSWRLYIDSSKISLMAVLLHNGNKYASVPIAHTVLLIETYENFVILLDKIKYTEHQWKLCVDLKISVMILGQQSRFKKMFSL